MTTRRSATVHGNMALPPAAELGADRLFNTRLAVPGKCVVAPSQYVLHDGGQPLILPPEKFEHGKRGE